MTSSRNTFSFIFTLTIAAVFLLITGLIGYQPPAHLSLDAATWRHGTWVDGMALGQIALGTSLLAVAGIVALRLNRTIKTKP